MLSAIYLVEKACAILLWFVCNLFIDFSLFLLAAFKCATYCKLATVTLVIYIGR